MNLEEPFPWNKIDFKRLLDDLKSEPASSSASDEASCLQCSSSSSSSSGVGSRKRKSINQFTQRTSTNNSFSLFVVIGGTTNWSTSSYC